MPACFGQELGFGARDKDVAIHRDFESAERGCAKNVLERFTLATPFDQFTQSVRLCGSELALEIQIQLHPGRLEHVREQQFDLQPWCVHALSREEVRTFLDGFKHCHGEV